MVSSLDQLRGLLLGGGEASSAKREVWELIETRVRAVAAESRRRKDEHEMVEKAQFGRFANAFLLAIATNVPDRALRGKIQEDALRVLGLSQVVIEAEAS